MKYSHTILCTFSFLLLQLVCPAQNGLQKGNALPAIEIKKLLNAENNIPNLSSLQSKLTVVDFFGTWCIPCLKALPHLNDIKTKFSKEVNVVLISNETEAQLTKFIKSRTDFSFPVIVDENNSWNNAFQPPALPYTVIINKEGKIVDITQADAITENRITELLADTSMSIVQTKIIAVKNNEPLNTSIKKSDNTIVQLSQEYMYNAKTGEPLTALTAKLDNLSYRSLLKSLKTDNEKKAFWINIYNGYTQSALKAHPELYKNRKAFFKAKEITIAGNRMSLDEIEHGFLRRSKIKWSLGYLNKLFPSHQEKQLRVDKLDYRIHFALNCGAKSCPPIAFYNEQTLDAQLNLATKAYLSREAIYDSSMNSIMLPKLMSWFRGDFGGKKGMRKILKKYAIIPQDAYPKIKFKKYNWQLYLDKYSG